MEQDNNDDLFPLRRGKIGDIEGNIGIGTLNPTEPSDLITSLFIANPNPNNEKEKRKQEKDAVNVAIYTMEKNVLVRNSYVESI